MTNQESEKRQNEAQMEKRVLARVHAKKAAFDVTGFSAKNLCNKGFYSDMDEGY